ncbi:MAG: DUF302 domain-containing protein [Atopostipes sp.]|nr:DUF302 domain-containing protein [Atopostipes sp.]
MKKDPMKDKMHHERKELVFEMETEKNLEEAINSLEKELKENSFGVLWQLNFKDKLAEKGLDFDEDFVVLEVCNPKQAQKVLEKNMHIGYVLPCKMVARTENGKTYLGMTDPEVLINLFEEADLQDVVDEVREALKNAIQAAV